MTRCLLLLPGLLDDARLWRHQVENLPGAMAMVADLTRGDSVALLAANALAQVPSERFALAGLSMGGYVALEIMRQAPDRVEGLALLDTSARPDTPEATAARHELMALADTDFPQVTRRLMPRLLHPDRLADEALTTLVASMADDVGKAAFFRQQRAIIDRLDSRPYLGRIDCPTLVLCGRDDAITPLAVHEEMADGIPDASLTIVEYCGHLSTLERPEAVTEAMKSWMDSL